jgi:DNA-directed RNA polymerase specialized sigma24 family protein
MVKPVSALQRHRFAQLEPVIVESLHRLIATRVRLHGHRKPLDLITLRALHAQLFRTDAIDLPAFVRYVAPLVRRIAIQVAERQAMIEVVQLKLIDLEQWLRRLDELDPDCVRIIELRYFAGLTLRQTASVLETTVPEILGQLRFAKAWLQARVRWSLRS